LFYVSFASLGIGLGLDRAGLGLGLDSAGLGLHLGLVTLGGMKITQRFFG